MKNNKEIIIEERQSSEWICKLHEIEPYIIVVVGLALAIYIAWLL